MDRGGCFDVQDDPQAGVDHVDGHCSLAYIVSPYIRRGQVNHTYYTQINMVRTIEGIKAVAEGDVGDADMAGQAGS